MPPDRIELLWLLDVNKKYKADNIAMANEIELLRIALEKYGEHTKNWCDLARECPYFVVEWNRAKNELRLTCTGEWGRTCPFLNKTYEIYREKANA